MARRYFVHPLPPAGPMLLSPKLGHYLGRIVRVEPDAEAILFDGAGHEVSARVLELRGKGLWVEVGEALAVPFGRSARLAVDVACALPRSARCDWLFAHGTEVGIRRFLPLVTSRTRRQPERAEHWRRILIEACAQCDRAVLPTIEATITLEELCAAPPIEERYVATYGETELGPASSGTALFVIGPEGGLTPLELEQLAASGFLPRSLGPLTLRTETAVIAGATRLLQAPPRTPA